MNQEQDTPSEEQDKDKHTGGRPLKFKTVEELDLAIQLYFDKCDPHIETHLEATGVSAKGETMFQERKVMTDQKPYTITGLARSIGLTRQGLLNYQDRDGFFDSVDQARQKCQEYAESQLFGPYANGAKFNLVNNYQGKYQPWADKQVVAGDPQAPLSNPLAALTADQLRKLADDQAEDKSDGVDGSDTA